jgi:transcriptional pleiotropic regulator of transition state genes
MRNTGIVRRIDDAGRIVIPMELRKAFNINNNDPVQIFVDDEDIIIRKYDLTCNALDKVEELNKYLESNLHSGDIIRALNVLKDAIINAGGADA